jgi:hypothetical protein
MSDYAPKPGQKYILALGLRVTIARIRFCQWTPSSPSSKQ